MYYCFRCDYCGQTRSIDIPMAKYDIEKNNQRCTKCNTKMERVIEWNGPATNVGGYSDVAGNASWQSGNQ